MSLLIFKIKVYPTNKALIRFEKKKRELQCLFSSLFPTDSVFANFTIVGKETALILVESAFQPWIILMLSFFFSFESNFLNTIDVIFPVWKEILA